MHRLKVFALILILSTVFYFSGCGGAALIDSGLDYTESTEILDNPWRGFYFTLGAKLKVSGNGAANSGYIAYQKGISRILHLRLGLEAFSSNAGGVDGDISADALRLIGCYMSAARENGIGVILRMSYDLDGVWSGGKYRDVEPSVSLMLRHIEQVGEVLGDFTDVLMAVESGMLGPWGEQHSTTAAGDRDNYYRIVQKWLDSVPEVTVSVRRPLYFVCWYNARYGTDYTIDTIDQIPLSLPETDEYRVGVYNDGYLGSGTDLGTYSNREKETAWLKSQAAHTFFGGEAVADSGGGIIGEYNNVAFLEREGFITHTSYLNIEWNNNLIAKWEENIYNGNNPVYKGKTTELHYIKNHLGYRFVLRESLLSGEVKKGGALRLKGRLENTGFAPLIKKTSAKIIITDGSGNISFEVSAQFDLNALSYDIYIDIPQETESGRYTVYVAFSGGIAFANNGGIFDSFLGANKLGNFRII